MKRVKICALALSACMAAGAMAGCKKTEETTEPSGSNLETVSSVDTSEAEPSTAGTSESSNSVISSESSSESSSEASSEASKSTPSSSDTQALPSSSVFELNEEVQEYANTYISNFVEQFFWDFDVSIAGNERYMDFVYLHLKINSMDSLSTEKKGEITYETFSVEQAQKVIGRYFGYLVSEDDIKKFPAPPDSFGDHSAGPYYSDGKIWYEAGSGESYNRIGIVDRIISNANGTMVLEFTIYEIDLDTYSNLSSAGFKFYYRLSSSKAASDKTLKKIGNGTAVVDISQSGGYLLKSYDVI